MTLTYAVVTPARDEEVNLGRLGLSLASQSVEPSVWIVVDNGSTDGSAGVVHETARDHAWVKLVNIPGVSVPIPGAPIVRAFHAGLEKLAEEPSVVVKMDADVSIPPDYFERLLRAFDDNPSLGIAGGVCLEQAPNGEWRRIHVTGAHVRGAVRAYRWKCLQDVLPLVEGMGWDGIDELKAATLGWETRTIEDLVFYHHRTVGARDRGRGARWRALGEGAHYMGYRWWYLLLRALHHSRRDPAALMMVAAFVRARCQRRPQHGDRAVREYLRSQQSLRHLATRFREATGRATRR